MEKTAQLGASSVVHRIKYYSSREVKKKTRRACSKHWNGVEVHTEVLWQKPE